MPTGLIRRGASYSLRRRVPKDLLPAYHPQKEITRALGTKDREEAKRLLALASVALDQEFAAARQLLIAAKIDAPAVGPSSEVEEGDVFDPDAFAVRAFATLRRKRDAAARSNALPAFKEWMREQLEWQQAALDHGPLDMPGETPAMSLVKAEGARTALRAMLTGDGAAILGRNNIGARTDGAVSGQRVSLTQLWERWSVERKPEPRSIKSHENVVKRFEKVNGKVHVAAITKAHVLAFKDRLVAEGQTPGNTNVLLTRLNTLLNFAVKNDLAEANPASGTKVADNRRRKDKRREWDADALNLLFSSPVYSNNERPLAGGGEAAYWLPLLALYTGARQTELGQLHPDDVVEEDYFTATGERQSAWVIRIVENEKRGQVVKNEGSERRVPVHNDIATLGFLTMVQQAKREKRERLFPAIRPGAHNELMGNWSKWFSRYRRAAGVTGTDTPFHAFRHSFKHYARLSRMPREVSNELTGHETGEVADDYGGLSYPLAPLVEGMAVYRVPGVTLPARPPGL